MELKQTNDLLENLPVESRSAIAELIDLKTNENMKELLAELKNVDSKLTSMDMRLKTLYWVIGVIGVPIVIYVFTNFFKS